MTFPISHIKPTPRHRLAAAMPHVTVTAPAQYLVVPSKLSMWRNDTEGVCIAAGEALAKATTGIFISDDTVQAWATKNNDLNGGDIESLLTVMQTAGFEQDGNTYNDGPHTAVDWTVAATLQSAISQGPVKIGVASAQLQNVSNIGQQNGWFATGFKTRPEPRPRYRARRLRHDCVAGRVFWCSAPECCRRDEAGLRALYVGDDWDHRRA